MTTAISVFAIKLMLLVVDPTPLFFMGDSKVYIDAAVYHNIPWSRSFTYGWLIRLFAVWPGTLQPLVVSQVLASALTAWLLALTLLRFFAVRPSVVIVASILFAVDPLQLIHERLLISTMSSPLIFASAVRYLPVLEPLWFMFNFLRIAVASTVLIVALVIVHKWLPCGRRRLLAVAPGIVVTLLLWLIAGELFGDYLARFAYARHLLRGLGVGDDRAGVPVRDRHDLHLRRRAQRRDPALARIWTGASGTGARENGIRRGNAHSSPSPGGGGSANIERREM